MDHCDSEWLPIRSGIPRGTVMGYVQLIICTDDLGVICSGSVNQKLFADDMIVYSKLYTDNDNVLLQSALDRLHQWCCNWQLSVNVGKCLVLHIGKTNHQCSHFFKWM